MALIFCPSFFQSFDREKPLQVGIGCDPKTIRNAGSDERSKVTRNIYKRGYKASFAVELQRSVLVRKALKDVDPTQVATEKLIGSKRKSGRLLARTE